LWIEAWTAVNFCRVLARGDPPPPPAPRPTQKNFASSFTWRAARWAIVASLLATAKLNDVEPFAYLKDVLERLSNGYPMNRLDDLLPWNWASPVTAAA